MNDFGIDFSDIAKEFREESQELLDTMEDALQTIREQGMDDELINAVFRAAHTIKGVAGMYKIDYLVAFTHIAENLLDQVRNGQVELDEKLGGMLLECKDHMQELVDHAVATMNEEPPSSQLEETSRTLGAALSAKMAGGEVQAPQEAEAPAGEGGETPEGNWRMEIAFGPHVMEHGFEPATFLAYLRGRCSVYSALADLEAIPSLEKLDPTKCYLSFTLRFATGLGREEILEGFEFIRDDCAIRLEEAETEEKENEAAEEPPAPEPLPEPRQQEKPSASAGKKAGASSPLPGGYSIRVDAEKIDGLINLIGEMVIANANVVQQATAMENMEMVESVSILSRMLEDIRESAMQIRMVQIGETFNRFKRIVMDLSGKLGKEVALEIKGGETELDKTVIEKITDPLVHIVRNSIDHGIESPEERKAAGKNARGTVTLNSYHDAGTVVIEITDDGKGLDEEVIYRKAVEKGLVEEGTQLNQKQVFDLILQPGFSTAPAVTDLSGRGVGMDVVKRNIEALRGNIEIKSQKGRGTSLIIRLPLTLAIIDGFLTKVGETFYVVPLEMVVECLELGSDYKKEMRGNNYINLRGVILSLLDVREFFGEEAGDSRRENIVVVQYAGRRFGLIVDELFGEFQTVIKPLGKIFRELRGISGATILGSGKVALILDVPLLMNHIASLAARQGRDETAETANLIHH